MTTELPIVTQADRDIAWPTRPECYWDTPRIHWDRGVYDNYKHIQSYVRHRIASTTEAADLITELEAALRELAKQVRWSNAVDDNGHHLENLKALHDAEALLAKATTHER